MNWSGILLLVIFVSIRNITICKQKVRISPHVASYCKMDLGESRCNVQVLLRADLLYQ